MIYASGSAAAIKKMNGVFEGFARARYDMDEFGNGIRMKLVAIYNISTAEAILMGERSGLDAATIVRVIADGAGGSRMFQVRGPLMVDRSWGEATMKVSTWQKDMKLINDMLNRYRHPRAALCHLHADLQRRHRTKPRRRRYSVGLFGAGAHDGQEA